MNLRVEDLAVLDAQLTAMREEEAALRRECLSDGQIDAEEQAALDRVRGKIETLSSMLADVAEPELLDAEIKLVRSLLDGVEQGKRKPLEGKLDRSVELLGANDIGAARSALKALEGEVLTATAPDASLPQAEADAVTAIDARLLDSQVTAEDAAQWDRAGLDEAISAMQALSLAIGANHPLADGLDANLNVLEAELCVRFQAEDALVSTSLTPEQVAQMSTSELQDALDTLRSVCTPPSPGQQGNIDLILTELSRRESMDIADDILANAQAVDTDKALTGAFAPMIDMLKVAAGLPDLPETMLADIEYEITRLMAAVAERQARADKIKTIIKTPTLSPDDPRLVELIDLVPGLSKLDDVADMMAAQQGLAEGIAKGYMAEIPMGGVDHPPVTDWVGFYIAYQVGIFKGLGKGIMDLVDAVAMLAKVGGSIVLLSNPVVMAAAVTKLGYDEALEYLKDQDAYVAKRKAQVDQGVKIAKAVHDLQNEFDTNAFGAASQVGQALGKIMANFEDDFAGKTDAERGEFIGVIVGFLALEGRAPALPLHKRRPKARSLPAACARLSAMSRW